MGVLIRGSQCSLDWQAFEHNVDLPVGFDRYVANKECPCIVAVFQWRSRVEVVSGCADLGKAGLLVRDLATLLGDFVSFGF